MFHPKYIIYFVLFIQFIHARPEQPDGNTTIPTTPTPTLIYQSILSENNETRQMAQSVMPLINENSKKHMCLCQVQKVIKYHPRNKNSSSRRDYSATLGVCELKTSDRNCTSNNPCWGPDGVPFIPEPCMWCDVTYWIKDGDNSKPNFGSNRCENNTSWRPKST